MRIDTVDITRPLLAVAALCAVLAFLFPLSPDPARLGALGVAGPRRDPDRGGLPAVTGEGGSGTSGTPVVTSTMTVAAWAGHLYARSPRWRTRTESGPCDGERTFGKGRGSEQLKRFLSGCSFSMTHASTSASVSSVQRQAKTPARGRGFSSGGSCRNRTYNPLIKRKRSGPPAPFLYLPVLCSVCRAGRYKRRGREPGASGNRRSLPVANGPSVAHALNPSFC